MPLSDAQPDALAMIYAKSLFALADAAGGQPAAEGASGELDEILELARQDKRFGEFLSSRVVPVTARAASLDRIFRGRVGDLTLRFLQVLNRKQRLSHLPAIAAAYDSVVQERYGRVEVDVYTAAPVPAEELAGIKQRLHKALGREPVLHPYTDPTMLGGVRFQVGDHLIDGSVSTQLRKLKDQLATNGAAEVRARAERMIGEAGR